MIAYMRKGGRLGAGGWMRVMVFGFCVIGAGCFAAAPVQHVRIDAQGPANGQRLGLRGLTVPGGPDTKDILTDSAISLNKVSSVSRESYERETRLPSNTTQPSDSYHPLLPSECQLDDSQLIFGSKIGEGSVGEIQSGLYQGTPVAIKTLKKEFEAGSPQWKDFVREATISAGLRHKNIVSTLGVTGSEPPVMVQELMEGGSVEDFLLMKQKQKGCPWQPDREQLLGWCKDLARALCYLHGQDAQILHRDVKPANVMLSKDRRNLKLGDFGLSKAVKGGEMERYKMSGKTGTIRYMAPEVFASQEQYTDKVDVYSCAMVMYMMATGEKPFAEFQDADQLGNKVVGGLRPSLTAVHWTTLNAIIERCWAPNSEDRPTAHELLQSLEALEAESKEESSEPFRSSKVSRTSSAAFSQIRMG